ncbi:hypothetical protein KKA15_03410 [Patescibacteria group bacterium]|nr:hypothetical protein [Patescibacteria group bacterium]
MENFDAMKYREELAKELKNTPKEKRREILEQEKQTPQYQEAAQESSDGKNRLEKLRQGESKEAILEGSKHLLEYFVEKYPQQDQDGNLNYTLGGSLAMSALMEAGEFELVDETSLPKVETTEKKEIPSESLKYFNKLIRKIGDIDFVPLESKYLKQEGAISREEGLSLNAIPQEALVALKMERGKEKLECDTVVTIDPKKGIARVNVDGKDVFVTEPKMMLAYKI